MKKQMMITVMSLVATLCLASIAVADVIPIVGYTITSTGLPNFGGSAAADTWDYEYKGSVVSGRVNHEVIGSGILNDTVLRGSIASANTPFDQTMGLEISLQLAYEANISSLTFYGGFGGLENTLIGGLGGVTVDTGNVEEDYLTEWSGPWNAYQYIPGLERQVDDYAELTDTQFQDNTMDIVLTGFITEHLFDPAAPTTWYDWFSISEIVVEGVEYIAPPDDNEKPEPVPEPSTILLLGLGLIGVAALGRKRFSPRD